MSIATLKSLEKEVQSTFAENAVENQKLLAEITRTMFMHGQAVLVNYQAKELRFSLMVDYPFCDDMKVWESSIQVVGEDFVDLKDDLIMGMEKLLLYFNYFGEPFEVFLTPQTTLDEFWDELTYLWGGEI